MEPIVDTNVTWGRWPFRRVPGDEPAEFVDALKSRGVSEAWVGSFDGLFHRDLAAVNERLAADCRQWGSEWLLPFGSINIDLPAWELDVERCAVSLQMPGIRLHPNYHDYRLDHPAMPRLFELAAERQLVVQICVTIEDERTQSHLARVPHVNLDPLPQLLKPHPELRVVLLNPFRSLSLQRVAELMTAGQVWSDFAMLEAAGALERFVEMAADRVVFGSHFPLFYYESSVLKLREAGLGHEHSQQVCFKNARQILSREANR